MTLARARTNWRAARNFWPWKFQFFYAHGKAAFDPVYPAVLAEIRDSPQPLLDLGCGAGMLAAYLRAGGFTAPILGIDSDGGRIEMARRAIGDDDTKFLRGDAREFPRHKGNVVMLDAVHYFDDAAQRELLAKIATSIAPGGVALIRVALNERNWRFALTKCEEWWIESTRWIAVGGWNFPTRDEMLAPFPPPEFFVEARPMWGLTPFNSYVFVCRREAAAGKMEK